MFALKTESHCANGPGLPLWQVNVYWQLELLTKLKIRSHFECIVFAEWCMLLRYRYYLSEVIRVRSQRAGPYAWMATPLLLLLVASTNTPSIQWQGKPGDVFANTFLISFQSRKSQRWQYKIFVILLCVSCLSKNHHDLTCSLPVDGSDHATSSALPFGLAELPPPAVIGITASQSRHSLSPLYVNNPRDSLYTSIHKVLVGSEPRDIGTVGLSPPCSARQHGGKHRY